MLKPLIRTGFHRHMMLPRLIAGAPLAGIGTMHLTGVAPLRPILDAQGVPMPGAHAVIVPLLMVAAGLMLVTGTLSRAAGAIGVGVMLGALHAHLTIETWPNPDEPPIVLPIAVLFCSVYVLVRGGGAWSVDRKLAVASPTAGASVAEPS